MGSADDIFVTTEITSVKAKGIKFRPQERCGKKRLRDTQTNILALFNDGFCAFSRHQESKIPGIAFADSHLNSKSRGPPSHRTPVGEIAHASRNNERERQKGDLSHQRA
jgi:hypothetical protein